MIMLTRTAAITAIKALGLSARATGFGQEIRVAFSGRGHENMAYYSDDPSDARATATAMLTQARTPKTYTLNGPDPTIYRRCKREDKSL